MNWSIWLNFFIVGFFIHQKTGLYVRFFYCARVVKLLLVYLKGKKNQFVMFGLCFFFWAFRVFSVASESQLIKGSMIIHGFALVRAVMLWFIKSRPALVTQCKLVLLQQCCSKTPVLPYTLDSSASTTIRDEIRYKNLNKIAHIKAKPWIPEYSAAF